MNMHTFDAFVFKQVNISTHLANGADIYHDHIFHFRKLLAVEATGKRHLVVSLAESWSRNTRCDEIIMCFATCQKGKKPTDTTCKAKTERQQGLFPPASGLCLHMMQRTFSCFAR